jgi:alkylation response protein AidB-like acyl-CoA dehydrogenase
MMDLSYSEEQQLLISTVRSMAARYRDPPLAHRRSHSYYAADFAAELESTGYLDAATTPGMGPLEAVLVIEEACAATGAVEVGASTLVGPHLSPNLPRPIALVSDISKAQRFLKQARTALVHLGDDVVVLDMKQHEVEAVESVFAYPYARFVNSPDLARAPRLGGDSAKRMMQWWRVSISAECSGLMRSAVDFTVEYVKERHVFGHPLGEFQAIQHRLAQCQQVVVGLHYITMKAAWSKSPLDADIAASYAQQHVNKLIFDLHQFNGAMGVTNEHKLHFWTYRFRALQSEAEGQNGSAKAIARASWIDSTPQIQDERLRGIRR